MKVRKLQGNVDEKQAAMVDRFLKKNKMIQADLVRAAVMEYIKNK